MDRLRALIVGCGNIAGRFDAARGSAGEPPLTHAGAYVRDGRFEIAGCVDPDERRRKAFMEEWGVPAGFRSADELTQATERFDVISICSPTPCHSRGIQVALDLKPKLIFCEKPVAPSAQETESLVRRCGEAGVPLAVNYTRRWDPAVTDLRKGIEQALWGPLRSVVGYYNRGLLNNGSHMLDLLCLLLGPLRVMHVGKPVDDFSEDDPSVPVWLEAGADVPVHLACGHGADFALFELQLVFANALISMEEGGMFWRERTPADSGTFAGFRAPGEGLRRAGGYAQAMLRSVDNIFGAIKHAQQLASNGGSALAAQRLCEEIRRL